MGLNEFLGLTHGWCWVLGALAFLVGYIAGSLREIYREVEPAAQAEVSEPAKPNTAHVIVGSLWRFRRDTGDPFPRTGPPVAKVLEVRDGWVRYEIAYCSGDTRRKVESFLYCYEPV